MNTSEQVNLDDVISKIQKLQAMASQGGNATENEVAIANAQIKRLLAKHNLSLAQVTSKKTTKPSIKEEGSSPVGSYGTWDQYLHNVVDEICSTRHFYRTDWGKTSVIFVGSEADVQIALRLYPILKKAVFSLNTKFMKEMSATGQHGSRNSHMLGVVVRMLERAREKVKMDTPAEQQQYGALMVVKGQEIQEYFDQKKMRKTQSRRPKVDGASYNRGLKDGNKVNISIQNQIG